MPVQSSCTYWANTACAAKIAAAGRGQSGRRGDSPPAMRINAVAEAYCSKHPHWPQGQGRPSLWVMICPSSGASPVAAPALPIDDNAPANAGTQGEQNTCLYILRRTGTHFGQHCRVAIVNDHRG